jgi:hypothetical protein
MTHSCVLAENDAGLHLIMLVNQPSNRAQSAPAVLSEQSDLSAKPNL